jgi:GNAT superfamily N-acetyltransferase
MQCIADTPGMAINLRSLERKGIPSGLTIERVGDSGTMRTWAGIQAASGGMHERSMDARLRWASHRGFDQDGRHQAYLARFCEQPVGCSLLHVWAGVAGVYQVATVPEARRRGIGRAMTMHALLEGKARGCDVGVLHQGGGKGAFPGDGLRRAPARKAVP